MQISLSIWNQRNSRKLVDPITGALAIDGYNVLIDGYTIRF